MNPSGSFRAALVAPTLRWIAADPAIPLDLATNLHLVAAVSGAQSFDWAALWEVLRHEQRNADWGHGYARRFRGLDVEYSAAHEATMAAPDSIGQLEARLELERLVDRAGLSPREAELVAALAERGGPGRGDLAAFGRERGLAEGTVHRLWHDARQKLRRASGG